MAFDNKWSDEDTKELMKIYYKYTADELAVRFNRTRQSVILKHSTTLSKLQPKRNKIEITKCPNCNESINTVVHGYFCKHCLKEFDNYGEFMAPVPSGR